MGAKPKPKVLIVDDRPENIQILMEVLRENYAIVAATSGEKALQLARKPPHPDIVLLDVMMPEMDGYETCTRLREDELTARIPIIFVTALGEARDEARGFNVGAVDYITKPISPEIVKSRLRSHLTIQALNKQLQQKNEALNSALQLREDLTNMTIHDLRNPLTSILLSCWVLERSKRLGEEEKQKIKAIQASGERLKSLVDSLLLMAKLESGKLVLQRDFVDSRTIVEDVIESLQEIAKSKKIQLELDFQTKESQAYLDAPLISRAIDNLVANAIKYSPSSSSVRLEVYCSDKGALQIQVIDFGSGVSEEMKQKIFERYETGEALENTQKFGLGLTFCKLAVEAHGGGIAVRDNTPKGSIFTIEIPQTPEIS